MVEQLDLVEIFIRLFGIPESAKKMLVPHIGLFGFCMALIALSFLKYTMLWSKYFRTLHRSKQNGDSPSTLLHNHCGFVVDLILDLDQRSRVGFALLIFVFGLLPVTGFELTLLTVIALVHPEITKAAVFFRDARMWAMMLSSILKAGLAAYTAIYNFLSDIPWLVIAATAIVVGYYFHHRSKRAKSIIKKL
ncbi:MAG: hypothetical protein ACPGO5_02070 [Patescibacteria group bacterium]